MKFFFSLLIIMLITAAGCGKNEDFQPCSPQPVEAELPAMQQFARDSMTAAELEDTVMDASGVIYRIISRGTGDTVRAGNTITVNYTGRFLTGVQFENNTDYPVSLASAIQGWQIALSDSLRVGGSMEMIVPSSLAFGCNSYTAPEFNNQPLYYRVEVIKAE